MKYAIKIKFKNKKDPVFIDLSHQNKNLAIDSFQRIKEIITLQNSPNFYECEFLSENNGIKS